MGVYFAFWFIAHKKPKCTMFLWLGPEGIFGYGNNLSGDPGTISLKLIGNEDKMPRTIHIAFYKRGKMSGKMRYLSNGKYRTLMLENIMSGIREESIRERGSMIRIFIRRNLMTKVWRSALLQRGLYISNWSENCRERISQQQYKVKSLQSVNEPRKLRDSSIVFS